MFNCVFVTFPCGILGQVWYLIASFPDLCHLSYLDEARQNVRLDLYPDWERCNSVHRFVPDQIQQNVGLIWIKTVLHSVGSL